MSTVVDAPFEEYLDTPNKSVRQNVPRKGVVLHHAAMTSLSGLQSLAMGGKQVSATAIAKDRISKRLMTDEFRAWSLSSAWGDSSFRSVETCNQSTEGWTISDESHWELAYLVAYWAQLDGFWPHRDGDPKTWTVIGHREAYTIWAISYGTACPGGMDLNLVTTRAQYLLSGGTAGGGYTPIQEDTEMTYALINSIPSNTHLPGVPKGAVFVGNGTDPLVWVGNWGAEKVNGVVAAEWSAQQIADRIGQVGMRGSGANLNKVYSRFPREGDVPAYVLGAANVTVPPVEIGDITVPAPEIDFDAFLDKLAARLQS